MFAQLQCLAWLRKKSLRWNPPRERGRVGSEEALGFAKRKAQGETCGWWEEKSAFCILTLWALLALWFPSSISWMLTATPWCRHHSTLRRAKRTEIRKGKSTFQGHRVWDRGADRPSPGAGPGAQMERGLGTSESDRWEIKGVDCEEGVWEGHFWAGAGSLL